MKKFFIFVTLFIILSCNKNFKSDNIISIPDTLISISEKGIMQSDGYIKTTTKLSFNSNKNEVKYYSYNQIFLGSDEISYIGNYKINNNILIINLNNGEKINTYNPTGVNPVITKTKLNNLNLKIYYLKKYNGYFLDEDIKYLSDKNYKINTDEKYIISNKDYQVINVTFKGEFNKIGYFYKTN